MKRRNENIRKLLKEIDAIVDRIDTHIRKGEIGFAYHASKEIKSITHRIKRTTWRGDKPKVYVTTDNTQRRSGQYATDY